MTEKFKQLPWQDNAKWLLSIYIPAICLIGIVISIIVHTLNSAELRTVQQAESHRVSLLLGGLDDCIGNILSDLHFLANSPIINELVNSDGEPDPSCLEELGGLFLEFSTHRKRYDQIRFLDSEGMETVRVNYNNGRPSLTPQKELQNKKGRYYFADTFVLGRGEVFISPLDLNIEHGQIEIPLKPMIRIGTPIFNQEGIKQGILMLNYFGTYLIRHISRLETPHEPGHLMLLNSDGYWLKSPNPHDEWAFMYRDRNDRTFAKEFPFEWERIESEDNGQFLSTNGLFSFSTAYPLSPEVHSSTGSGDAQAPSEEQLFYKDYKWKIVSWIPANMLEEGKKKRTRYGLIVFAFLALPLLLLAHILSSALSARRQAEDSLRKAYASLEDKVAARTEKLQKALDEVTTLRGIIPICSYCKQIRDDKGAWKELEAYISSHSEAQFSHGACPECCAKQLKKLEQE